MSEAKETALREAGAIAEGKLSALLVTLKTDPMWFKCGGGFNFLQKKLQECHDELETARLTR